MLLLHKGFDALDLSLPLTISTGLADELEGVKAFINSIQQKEGIIDFERSNFLISEKGAPGGFAYLCKFVETDNIWFLKKPNQTRDKWGTRISCAAHNLSLDGIQGVREHLSQELAFLKLAYEPGIESIGRVDFAMDFLAPDFVLSPDNFIMHARNGWSQHIVADDVQINGRSGRTTSVTIGKNPNRQIIIYDKREETKKKPSHMPYIWEDNLTRMGEPHPDWTNPASSRVWRVEIRFFKQYLKNKAGILTFADLANALPDLLRKTIDQIRYCVPSGDSNRARWKDHPLWLRVREEIECDFSTIRSEADKESVKSFVLAEKDQYLARQIAGCMLNRAALRGIDPEGVKRFVLNEAQMMVENFASESDRTKKKLDQAKLRYRTHGKGKAAS